MALFSHFPFEKVAPAALTVERCLDVEGGFKSQFVVVSSEHAAVSYLQRSEVAFGFLSTLRAKEAENAGVVNIQLLSAPLSSMGAEKMVLEKSALIVRSDSPWKIFESPPESLEVSVAHTNPASDYGFILPREILANFSKNRGPAVFAGQTEGVVSLVKSGQVALGTVPAGELVSLGLPTKNVREGQSWGGLRILKLSESLPVYALASSWELKPKITTLWMAGFQSCLKKQEVRNALWELTGSKDFQRWEISDLGRLERILGLQATHPRILSLR